MYFVIICETIYREIDQYKEKNKYMQNQLRKTEKELSSCFAEIDKLRAVNSVLSRAVEWVFYSDTSLYHYEYAKIHVFFQTV